MCSVFGVELCDEEIYGGTVHGGPLLHNNSSTVKQTPTIYYTLLYHHHKHAAVLSASNVSVCFISDRKKQLQRQLLIEIK